MELLFDLPQPWSRVFDRSKDRLNLFLEIYRQKYPKALAQTPVPSLRVPCDTRLYLKLGNSVSYGPSNTPRS